MKRYSSYKSTGIQWLPEIPSHWEVLRFGSLFKRKPAINKPEEELLSVFLDRGVIKASDSDKRTHQASEDLSKYQLVEPSDFVMNNQQAWRGSVGVSDYTGIISPAYHIFPMPSCYDYHYANYLLRDCVMVNLFDISSKGVGSIQRTLNFNWLNNGKCLLPPIEEQRQIVAYLDKKLTLIETCKCQRERELQTLNELKQAEIASVVTRGLNPNVPMAYMDTPLKTMHPAHWTRVRNMTFLVDQNEKVGKRSDDFQLLSLTTNGVIVRDVESGKGKFPKDFETYKIVEPGELVFCLFDIDETPRTVGLSNNYGMITGAYDVFKVKDTIVNPSYVYAFYLVVDNIKALRPYYSGLRKVVKHNRFMQIGFPLPPIEEQNAIVEYIKSKTCKIDSMIDSLKQEIERLTEFKQRLISDVVTGQIDVRSEKIG